MDNLNKEYLIVIVADTNDADYITQVSSITQKQLNKIKPLINAIKNFKPYTSQYTAFNNSYSTSHSRNYPKGNGDIIPRYDMGEKNPKDIYPNIDKEVFELFDENFCPIGKHGIHTIKSIELFGIEKRKKLL